MQFDHKKVLAGFQNFYKNTLKIQLNQTASGGIDKLLFFIENDPEWQSVAEIAYVLATVLHETGAKMIPRKEERAAEGTRVWEIQNKYWYSGYYGRSYIQLTWLRNYQTFSKLLGIDLVTNPDLALRPEIGYQILAQGVRKGLFTGKKLSDYINDASKDFVNSRKIVNGTDRAELIADYARKIETILNNSLIKEDSEIVSIPTLDTQQPVPTPTTITTTTEVSTPQKTTVVEVEKNIPAPTQYIDHAEPTPVSGLNSWKTAISGITGSVSIGGILTWLSSKYEMIKPYLGEILALAFISALVFGVVYLITRAYLNNKNLERAHQLTLAQLHVRANPSLANVEVIQKQ